MNILSICENSNILKIILFIKTLIDIVKFIVPIGLIIMVSIDLGKGVISGNAKPEKIIKASGNKILAAMIIFLLPTIVNFTLIIIDEKTSYESCWANAEISTIKKYEQLEDETKQKAEEEKRRKEEEKRKEEEEKNNSSNSDGTSNSGGSSSSENNSSNESYLDKKESIKVTNNITKNYYKSFTYYLYLPNNLKSNLPIIVFLHGLGQRGNDYSNNSLNGITWGPLNEVRNYGASYNAIIIAPQVPSNSSVNSFTKNYISLTNEIATKYNANRNKISVMGFSHGCYGVMQIVNENPKYFSAVVPVACGWHPKNRPVERFTNQAVWAITGEGDGKVAAYAKDGYKPLLEFVNAINANGGNAKFTYLEGKPHNIFNNSYSILRDSNYNVINWMISQTK